MSVNQNYFPPRGTRLKWGTKPLNHSPWYCNVKDQMFPNTAHWTMNISCYVELHNDGFFHFRVEVCDWNFQRKTFSGKSKDALSACLEAERVGLTKIKKLTPRWVLTALKNKWRPPCVFWLNEKYNPILPTTNNGKITEMQEHTKNEDNV